MRTLDDYNQYKDAMESNIYKYFYNNLKLKSDNIYFSKNYIDIVTKLTKISIDSVKSNSNLGYTNIRLFGPYNKYNIKLYKKRMVDSYNKIFKERIN